MSQEGTSIIDPVLSLLRNTMSNCKETFANSWQMCSNVQQLTILKTAAETTMIKLIRSELIHTESNLVLEDIEAPNISDDATGEEIERALVGFEQLCEKRRQDYIKKISVDRIKKHPEFVLLQEIMDEATRTISETDLETSVTEVVPIVDPVTRQFLKDPVRNRICRHVYGKKAIQELIKKSQKIRCPQLGCGNREFIKMEDLEEDAELSQKVREKIFLAQNEAKAGASSQGKPNRAQRRKLDDTTDIIDDDDE